MLLFQAPVDAGSVDVLHLYRHEGSKRLFALLLPDALIIASASGLTDVVCLLLDCVVDTSDCVFFDCDMLQCAVVNAQESTVRFLLPLGAEPDFAMVNDMITHGTLSRPAEDKNEVHCRIVTALLDAGLSVPSDAVLESCPCIVQSPRILKLLRANRTRARKNRSINPSGFLTS